MEVDLLNYYGREDIQKAILKCAKDREIAIRFNDSGFGKRPEILQYKSDVFEFAKQGATSFHCSVERWKNPSQLTTTLSKKELDGLRSGWDLLIDIDCPFLEYSKITANLIVMAMKAKGIKSMAVKFSGNHGFHIAVPFEAFPREIVGTEIKEVKDYFPDGVRIIALYLQEMIRKHLSEEILKKERIEEIIKKTKKKFNEVVVNGVFDPFKIVSIDSLMISSRHLFRMPFSINEKSWLASVTIDPQKILEFDIEIAKPENVKVEFDFLNREDVKINEAKNLFDDAFQWNNEFKIREEYNSLFKKDIKIEKKNNFSSELNFVDEVLFPPCIKKILNGLEDGRKRSLFVLTNFLSCCGWNYEQIENLIKEWNKKNKEPLRENYIMSHLKYFKQKKKIIPPPNCREYYKELSVCFPDSICERIKNPVSYARIKGFKKE